MTRLQPPFRFFLLLSVGIFALHPADILGAADEGIVLVDETQLNGSFESGLRPWVSPRAGGSAEHFAESEKVSEPAHGEQVLVLRTVNNDQQRNSAAATVAVKEVDLEKGRWFRVTWKARTRDADEFTHTAAQIVGRLPDGTSQTAGRPHSGALSTEWSEHSFETYLDTEESVADLNLAVSLRRQTADAIKECEGYIDHVRLVQFSGPAPAAVLAKVDMAGGDAGERPQNPIPVKFHLEEPAYVTLVIEDESGNRIRNLVSGERFDAGEQTVWWDGLDEGVPVLVPGSQAQRIERMPVPEGAYKVRGLKRDQLELTYDFTVLPNVGNPPWPTELSDGSGGWLADHGAPAGVAHIPAELAPGGVEQMLLASTVAESAQALAWVDLDGNKLAGRRTLGGHFTGASHLAADRGEKRNPEVYLYTHAAWRNRDGREIRLMGLTKEGPVLVGRINHPFIDGEDAGNPVEKGVEGAIAVHNGVLVYSLFGPDRLYFLDVRELSVSQEGVLLGEAVVESPHALAFEPDGALLVLSGKRVLRYQLGEFPNPLSEPEVLIAEGLEEPRSLSVDEQGNLYIGDWGTSHQVKVYSPEGVLVRTLGKPGAPSAGKIDPEKMHFPFGVAVTPSGQVWVTMRPWRTPKTVAVWTTDGEYLRSFYGPSAYGGGGFLDPNDPTRLLYSESTQGGVEFEIDWEKGDAEPTRVYWLSSETPAFQPARWTGPMFPRRIDGRDYITNEFGGPTSGAHLLTVWKENSPDGMQPAAIVGRATAWPQVEEIVAERFPEIEEARHPATRFRTAQTLLVAWSDANGDGLIQEEELQFRSMVDEPGMGLIRSASLAGDDFTILITHEHGVYELKPRRVEEGVPHYDLSDLNPVASDLSYEHVRSSGRSQVLQAEDGTLVITGGPIMGVKDDQVKWIYHSQWPSLHIGHAAPRLPEYPGQILAATRLLGPLVKPKKGDGGQLWALNSDRGVVYLFTSDGFFVDTLFRHPGEGEVRPWNMEESMRGMDLTEVNAISEHFFPSINQLPDGRIYLVAGKSHSSLVRVDGLESIRRFDAGEVQVDADTADAVREHLDEMALWERSQQGSGTARIAHSDQPLEIGANLADWPTLDWLPVGKGRITRRFTANDVVWTSAALAVDKENLYMVVRTRQRNLLGNSGSDPQVLFTTGGAVDLQLSTREVSGDAASEPQAGDVRLLVSMVDGEPFVMRFRPKVPGTKQPVVYESDVAHTEIDAVEEVSSEISVAASTVKLDKVNGGLMGEGEFEQIEIVIPLSVLDWDPDSLPLTRGDLGVLLGRPGTTTERVYWHNMATGLTSDIPSEAALRPQFWGGFHVQNKTKE